MAVTYTYEGKELTKKEYVAKLREKYMQTLPQAIHAGKSNACGIMISLIWITS